MCFLKLATLGRFIKMVGFQNVRTTGSNYKIQKKRAAIDEIVLVKVKLDLCINQSMNFVAVKYFHFCQQDLLMTLK